MKPAQSGRAPLEERIAVGCMALLVVITLLNVVTRYFTDESFAWTEEISVILMVVLTLSGAAAVAQRDGHIRIEFLLSRTPSRGLWRFGTLLTSLVCMVLAALFARWTWDQYRFEETSMGLGLPLWWYGAALPPLCLALALRAFAAFMRDGRGAPAPAADHDEGPL